MAKTFKYLIDSEFNVSYVKVDSNFSPPTGWTLSDTKPQLVITIPLINKQRDILMAKSPLSTPYGDIDYDPISREKLSVACKAMNTLDKIYPENAPHKTDWTMYDNSIVPLGLTDFEMIDLVSAQRGTEIHTAAKRVKVAITNNVIPQHSDLVLLELL